MTAAEFRKALSRVYYPLFGRHGQPRPIQLQSVEPLYQRRDVLLMAPSAAGKTEAYCAPLCERLLAEGWDAPAILIVSPTRALANDLHRRLERPLDELQIRFGRWTGEHKECAAPRILADKRGSAAEGSLPGGADLPQVVIVTPESLDSLLSRSPARLRPLRCIVLDELHVLDGGPRGDQLRLLLGRLRHLGCGGGTCGGESYHGERLQVVAASATVADPQGMAGRYLSDALVIRDEQRRVLLARVVRGVTAGAIGRELVRLCRRTAARKLLIFANRRDQVEQLAAELRAQSAFPGEVFAHHGSLSRALREATEERFLAAPRAVCVATMTLELGIDIGDIDVVGLLHPPPDVSSLLQRVGRSGRRGAGTRALCFASDETEMFRFRVLLELASEGDLAADPARFHPSVLVQQAVSILHQNPGKWLSARAMHRRLDAALAARWSVERLEQLLDQLAHDDGWLERSGRGRYVAAERTEQLWSRGRLHANISAQSGREVVDQLTGEILGSVASSAGAACPPDGGSVSAPPNGGWGALRIGGRGRRILWQDEERIVVGEAARAAPSRFVPSGALVMSRALAQAHARKLGLAGGQWPLAEGPGGEAYLLHFGGTAWGEVLAAAVVAGHGEERSGAGGVVLATGPFALSLAHRDVAHAAVPRLVQLERAALEDLCRRHRKRLARVLAMGPYHRYLPAEQADEALFEVADLQGLAAELARARIAPPPPDIDTELWQGLAQVARKG